MRIILLSLFVLLNGISQAQITLDRNDFGIIGDTVILERTFLGLDTIDLTNSGANQNWDYSFLAQDSIGDSIFFLNPSSFPQSSQVPNANLVLKDANALQFIEANANGIYIHGLTLDLDTFFSNLFIKLNPRMPQYTFPSQFGQTSNSTHTSNSITLAFQDTITIAGFTSYVDSVRIVPTIQKNDIVDSWGQLTLPNQKTFGVLRQKSVLTISLGVEVLIPNPLPFPPPFFWFQIPSGTVPDMVNTNYLFTSNGKKYPLLEFTADSSNTAISARFQLDTTGSDTLTAINDIFVDLKVYPNPAENQLKVYGAQTEQEIEMTNLLGKVVLNGLISADQNHINISHLKPGIYILNIQNPKNGGAQQFKILKE